MEIQETIGLIFFVALASASASQFLEYCYMPGSILAGYYDWLLKKEKEWKADATSLFAPLLPMLKPAGLCIYCQNVYIAITAYAAAHFLANPYTGDGPVWCYAIAYGLSTIVLSHSFFRVLWRVVYLRQ